tara:strand:- start:676 stop:954 length:279 start_codon:yes stop_codon:yes gene_type:complete
MSHILKKLIQEIAQSDAGQMHQCFGGHMVPFGSPECIQDLELRISDATSTRDNCPGRTDSREHYNGILKVLRRDLRGAKKTHRELHPEEIEA